MPRAAPNSSAGSVLPPVRGSMSPNPAAPLLAEISRLLFEGTLSALFCVILPRHKPAAKRASKAITKHLTKGH